jgi:hypothetical protein
MLVYPVSLEQPFPPAHSRNKCASCPNSLLARTPRPHPAPTRTPRRSLRPAVAEAKAHGAGGSHPLLVAPQRSRRHKMPPFSQVPPLNSSRINTSKIFSHSCILLIIRALKFTRINTSGDKDLKSLRINTSGHKDLKSFRINTSKKQGRGWGPPSIRRQNQVMRSKM